ncbi:putative diguanylate cyclase YdaM [Natranaerofaba carboxydovora]|nr:putative diguanylate cyclase YdaM [Natranaerofaba carboxydovora]
MADFNGLKMINDSYGHKIGDEVLKRAAKILKESCRKKGLIARWGGDEFVIILPKSTEIEANDICNFVIDKCRNNFVKDIPISMALGNSTMNQANKSLTTIMKEAEDDMYKQKIVESKSARSAVLNNMLKTLEAKSFETSKHTRRMQEVARKIGKKLGLPISELNRLSILITLHDIGKINMPESILTKKEKLTNEE